LSDLKISIITPSYNQGCFIEETILSVINQTYSNVEYIVIDGGSKDNTVDIIKKYSSQIDYWVSESDDGQSHAINKGLEVATGDIVTWLNSDDQYFSSNVVSEVNSFFNNYENASACYADNVYVDSVGDILYLRKAPIYFSHKILKKWNFIHQPTVFLRKGVIDEVSLRNELNFVMDYDYWLRISSKFKFKYLNKIVSASRWHSNCKTIGNSDKAIGELKGMLKKETKSVAGIEISPFIFSRLSYNFQRVFSLLFIYRISSEGRFSSIKVLSWWKIAMRQIFGLRFDSK
jgi:glycosyltransferase involved in cell wall biosynthesis